MEYNTAASVVESLPIKRELLLLSTIQMVLKETMFLVLVLLMVKTHVNTFGLLQEHQMKCQLVQVHVLV